MQPGLQRPAGERRAGRRCGPQAVKLELLKSALAPVLFVPLLDSHLGREPETATQATAWYGYVISSELGDRLMLAPREAGGIAVLGAEVEQQTQIAALRDRPEPGRHADFWGG